MQIIFYCQSVAYCVLKGWFLPLQKDAAKGFYKYHLEHSNNIDVLTQAWRYAERYLVLIYVHKYDGHCQCKFKSYYILKSLFLNDLYRIGKQRFKSVEWCSGPQKLTLTRINV